MGYSVGTACYSNLADAADAYYSATAPRLSDTGYSAFEKTGAGWQLNTYQNGPQRAVLTSSVSLSPQLPECNLVEQVRDGAALGWLVLLPAFIAWGIVVLRRTLQT
ncbi:hypothetical protein JQK19_10560 [Chromobacterium violaceum]|uniref:hypothetical protein n=1 Tax=Chromobacterium violaceum TaxID=536 RepID=UPI001BEBCE75|nr:hypothetical protein [Chromobacterium violaceum]MBT2867680.1 hypothetical protein [Chromobacterium violaceum]